MQPTARERLADALQAASGCRRARLPDPPRAHELERGWPHPGPDRHSLERRRAGAGSDLAAARRLRTAAPASPARWHGRARRPALLGFADPPSDPRLAEMRWGNFEGRTLDEPARRSTARRCAISRPGARFPAARRREPADGRRPAGILSARPRGDGARPSDRHPQGRPAGLAGPRLGLGHARQAAGALRSRAGADSRVWRPIGRPDLRGRHAACVAVACEPRLALPVLGPEPPGLGPSAPRPCCWPRRFARARRRGDPGQWRPARALARSGRRAAGAAAAGHRQGRATSATSSTGPAAGDRGAVGTSGSSCC